jgi:hypothetical protein
VPFGSCRLKAIKECTLEIKKEAEIDFAGEISINVLPALQPQKPLRTQMLIEH